MKRNAGSCRPGVKRGVDFNGVEAARVIFEPVGGWQVSRIKGPAPLPVKPARTPDEKLGWLAGIRCRRVNEDFTGQPKHPHLGGARHVIESLLVPSGLTFLPPLLKRHPAHGCSGRRNPGHCRMHLDELRIAPILGAQRHRGSSLRLSFCKRMPDAVPVTRCTRGFISQLTSGSPAFNLGPDDYLIRSAYGRDHSRP